MTDARAITVGDLRRCRKLVRCLGLVLSCLLAGAAAVAQATGYADAKEALERKEYAPARTSFLALAETGDARAMFYLGVISERGLGVETDPQTAFSWYERAAVLNHAEAQFNLGNLFKHGRGTVRSQELATYWWQKAAAQGQPNAQYNLALHYYRGDGLGVSPDLDAAVYWFHAAAAAGHPRARALVASGQLPEPPPGYSPEPLAASPKPQRAPAAPSEPLVAPQEAPAASPKSPAAPPKSPAAPPEAPATADDTDGEEPSPVAGASWLARRDPRHYAIQLAVLSSPANVETFVADHDLRGRARGVKLRRDGRNFYHILLGDFGSRADAMRELATLSPALKKLKPWARPFAELQDYGEGTGT